MQKHLHEPIRQMMMIVEKRQICIFMASFQVFVKKQCDQIQKPKIV